MDNSSLNEQIEQRIQKALPFLRDIKFRQELVYLFNYLTQTLLEVRKHNSWINNKETEHKLINRMQIIRNLLGE